MTKYRLGQILEEVKITADDGREPGYFEVVRVYDPPLFIFSEYPIYADVLDISYGNIISLDEIYEVFIKPVEEVW